MSWTCFECYITNRTTHDNLMETMSVARDASLEGRKDDAKKIREEIVGLLNGDADYFISTYKVYHSDTWPDAELVWAPAISVSVGECESCAKVRPCIND